MATTARGAAETKLPPDVEAWTLLRQLMFGERRRFTLAAAEFDLHPAQAGALMHLDDGVGLPMHEMASQLACDNSNVTGLVDRLQARGLVMRQPSEQDRRVKNIALTPAGVALRDQLRRRLSHVPEGLARLSTGEQTQLRDLLRSAVAAGWRD
jgi:MarR family transcriptional regulator, organic hydroperoxide resistance regulator